MQQNSGLSKLKSSTTPGNKLKNTKINATRYKFSPEVMKSSAKTVGM
jgi:hypothetical protein